MKILKIEISGYKLLKNNFEIDFLTKARVNEFDKEDEVLEKNENLYMPTVTVFTGKNSSGKSTVLNLLKFVGDLLYNGRVEYNPLDFREKNISLTLFFSIDNSIYKYEGVISKPDNIDFFKKMYCIFSDEKLHSRKYLKSYGKNILNMNFEKNENINSDVSDTSILYKITNKRYSLIDSKNFINAAKFSMILELISDVAKISNNLMLKIVNLFDESIKKLNYDKDKKIYTLDILGVGEKIYSESEIDIILSEGTKKGLCLFGLTILTLKFGATLIIDEIENSFHKNLVENIIMIFNDKRINKNNANLIFSTHYVEILDIFRRRDNIFIMSKNDYITSKNLYIDYKERIDLSKSNQFNNNTFKTLVNYEKLMDVKKELMNEISNND